jgi:hypothetical protein
MCALCGVLGGSDHWTDATGRPGVFTRMADPLERRRERARRVSVANRILRHFGMQVSDWQGASFLLSTATGKTEMVENLSHLWSVAERLSGRPCDPLDPALLRRLEAAHD